MISSSTNVGGQSLITAITSLLSLILQGESQLSIRPFRFGASLIALEKKGGGGIRPITNGCLLRRLAAKVAGVMIGQK